MTGLHIEGWLIDFRQLTGRSFNVPITRVLYSSNISSDLHSAPLDYSEQALVLLLLPVRNPNHIPPELHILLGLLDGRRPHLKLIRVDFLEKHEYPSDNIG
jgi:hypothetical protein